VLRVHPQGYGFAVTDDGESEYYVRARNMGTALDGDRVSLGITAVRPDDRKAEAEVLEVLERGRTSTVGTFNVRGRIGVVAPDDPRLTHDVVVAPEDFAGARDGDKVSVSLEHFDDARGAPEGRVLRILGPAADPRTQVLAIAMSRGIDPQFADEALEEADAAPDEPDDEALRGREDFRSERVFTIDPVDARDFDDALHVRRLADDRFEVGVHIADVSHFVTPGSALDREAFERGTSTYLVDLVIHMLPERLSSNLCSLRPEEVRLTYSCVLTLDSDADVVDYRIVPSVIRSSARLTYEEAQAVLDGGDSPLADDIRTLGGLARRLTERRTERGAINFDLPEVRVVLDEAGFPVDLVRKDRLMAHRLIEEFMILANETVARHAGSRPFVYRVHEHPDRERIRQLIAYVRAFGYRISSQEGLIAPQELNRLLSEARGRPEEPVITENALRAMAKARYAPGNIGHFGLASRHYTHFTSPIRRYPDLMVHRLLRGMAAGDGPADPDDLKAQCDHCSDRERAADDAQRDSVKLKQVQYMQQHVGDRFTGVVSGVARFGVFVELDSILVEGLIHVRDLADDYYEYDEAAFSLVGRSTGRRFRLGDPLTVVVAAASEESRTIDFVLA
jgi:ribonuclease R